MSVSKVKPYMLPAAMVLGAAFHSWIGVLAPAMPYLLAAMLFITYCRIRLDAIGLPFSLVLLLVVQIGGGVGVYFLLRPVDALVAQGARICVMCPVATAAPVVTGMLGGNVERVMAFSVLSNVAVALVAPLMLAYVGHSATSAFSSLLLEISAKVLPLLLLPLLAALLFRRLSSKACAAVARRQSVSFYLWAVTLTIVMARAFNFILTEADSLRVSLTLAFVALVACVALFAVGHLIGLRYHDAVASTQSLGQKNTILALWMSLSFLNPLSSVAPASYIIWQNIINSAQLFRFSRHEQHL